MDKCFNIKFLNQKNIVVEDVDVFSKNNKLSGEFDIYYLKSENKYIYSDKDRSRVLGIVDFDIEESKWVVVRLREKTRGHLDNNSISKGPYILPLNDTPRIFKFTPNKTAQYMFETINVNNVPGLDTIMQITSNAGKSWNNNDFNDNKMAKIGGDNDNNGIKLLGRNEYTIKVTNNNSSITGKYEIKINSTNAVNLNEIIWVDIEKDFSMQIGPNGPYTLRNENTEILYTFTPSKSGTYTFKNELTKEPFESREMQMNMTFVAEGVDIKSISVDKSSPNFDIDMTKGVKYTIKIVNIQQDDETEIERFFYVQGKYKINISLKEAAAVEENAEGGGVETFEQDMGPYMLPLDKKVVSYIFTPSKSGTYTFETINVDEVNGLDTNMNIWDDKFLAENDDIDYNKNLKMSKIENITLVADTKYTIYISNVSTTDTKGPYKIKVIGPGTLEWNDAAGHPIYAPDDLVILNEGEGDEETSSLEMGPYMLPTDNNTDGSYIFTPYITGTYTFETINTDNIGGLDTGMVINEPNGYLYKENDNIDNENLMSKIENITLNQQTEYTITISNGFAQRGDVGGPYKIKISGPIGWNNQFNWIDDGGHELLQQEGDQETTIVETFEVDMGPYTLPTDNKVGSYIFTSSIAGPYTFETINTKNIEDLDTEMTILTLDDGDNDDGDNEIEEYNNDIDFDNDNYMSKIENITLDAYTEYTINISNVYTTTTGPYKIKVIGPGTWNDKMWVDVDGHDKYQEGATVDIDELTNNLISNTDFQRKIINSPYFQKKIIELFLQDPNLKTLTDGIVENENFANKINNEKNIANIIKKDQKFIENIQTHVQSKVDIVAIKEKQVDEQIKKSKEFQKINSRIENLELDNI